VQIYHEMLVSVLDGVVSTLHGISFLLSSSMEDIIVYVIRLSVTLLGKVVMQ